MAPADKRLLGGHRRSCLLNVDRSELVSVITIAFNSIKTIERAIDSIVAQTYPTLEYIVIDGGSTDGTVELLKRRSDVIDLWVSEPDRGISDAFNKGIALATGEYIAIVNSDDWLEPQHLATAIGELKGAAADFVFGDLMLHSTDAKPAYILVGDKDYRRRLAHAMPHINHPTVVCRRRVYEVHGLFDTKLRAAMDYEWLLRGSRAGVVGRYVPGLMSHMSLQGISNRQFSRGLREVCEVSIRYGYPTLLAKMRYMTRVLKINARLALSNWMPKSLYEWLRRRVNAHYRSNSP
jgi:glycosyltransferase involved in cell wall biosynthesis